jgi:hypothetical protein
MLPRNQILAQLLATPAGQPITFENTIFCNILRANPSLARFYGDFVRRLTANPSLLRDLQIQSGIFFNPDQAEKNAGPAADAKKTKGNSMAAIQNPRTCTHIKVNGVRCGSPALRNEVFCYFHQRLIRGVRTPAKSRIHPIAMLEDPQAIQASLMEVINALVRNHIEVNRARLIIRALFIAAKNADKARFSLYASEMVTEVPQYPAAPITRGTNYDALEQAEVLAEINAPKPIPNVVDPALLRTCLHPINNSRAQPQPSASVKDNRSAQSPPNLTG